MTLQVMKKKISDVFFEKINGIPFNSFAYVFVKSLKLIESQA